MGRPSFGDVPGRLWGGGIIACACAHTDTTERLSLFTFMHWRRNWQPTPVFLPGKSDGQRSVVGNIPWGHKESDMTEKLHFTLTATVQGWGC